MAIVAIDGIAGHALIIAAAGLSCRAVMAVPAVYGLFWDALVIGAALEAFATDVTIAVDLIGGKTHFSGEGTSPAIAMGTVSAISSSGGQALIAAAAC